jgi:hypothetical protein
VARDEPIPAVVALASLDPGVVDGLVARGAQGRREFALAGVLEMVVGVELKRHRAGVDPDPAEDGCKPVVPAGAVGGCLGAAGERQLLLERRQHPVVAAHARPDVERSTLVDDFELETERARRLPPPPLAARCQVEVSRCERCEVVPRGRRLADAPVAVGLAGRVLHHRRHEMVGERDLLLDRRFGYAPRHRDPPRPIG